jgi:hypothetical protein
MHCGGPFGQHKAASSLKSGAKLQKTKKNMLPVL